MAKKLLLTILTIFMVLLTGCSMNADKEKINKDELSHIEGETMMVSHRKVLTEGRRWSRTQYVGDTLYYGVSNASGGYIYEICGDTDPKLILESEHMLVGSFSVDTEGNIYFLSMEEAEGEKLFSLWKFDEEGKKVFCKDASSFVKDILTAGCADAALTEDGYCVLNGYGACFVWDTNGNEIVKYESEWFSETEANGYLDGEYGLINGSEGVYVYRVKGRSVFLQLIGVKSKQLCEEIIVALPISFSNTLQSDAEGYSVLDSIKVYSGHDQGIYISDREKLYRYLDSEKELSEVVSWSEPGLSINRDFITEIRVDERGIPILYGYDGAKQRGLFYGMEIKPVEDFVQRTIEIGSISMWASRIEDIIESYIEEYNESQSENKVVLKVYDDLTDLHLALVQGKGPDILHLQGLDIDEYIEKDILENMDPYFEESDGFKKGDILPAVQKMISRDKSVYYLFPSFVMDVTVLGNSYAEKKSITTKDFLTMIPDGEDIYLCNQNMQSAMLYLTHMDLEQYVDWEKKRCSFDDGRFEEYMAVLKGANFPENGSAFSTVSYAEKINNGKYASILGISVSNTFDYWNIKEAFDKSAQIIGVPNQKGKELYPAEPNAGLIFGINHASEQKEASWDFLEYYILAVAGEAERHLDEGRSFSILKDTFEKQLYPVANPEIKYSFWNSYSGEMYEGYPVITDEMRDELRNMADKLVWSTSFVPSGKVGEIVTEEMLSYLRGNKTAKEVADIIQSRVSIYMSE